MKVLVPKSKLTIEFALLAVGISQLQLSDAHASFPASLENTDLPWRTLEEKLSPTASLMEASNEAFAAQCDPGFEVSQFSRPDDIVEADSGLCVNSFVCAFQNCLPTPDHSLSINENLSKLYAAEYEDVMKWKDPSNPNYGLPSSVLFPATAGDIAAAVQFANENNIELSVKSSGHSYSSQSSKKDSLLLNTVRYMKYSPTGIVECDANTTSSIVNSDLSNQPCVLSLAKNKNAYIRVATGESFGDVYQSVHDFNEEQDVYKYHLVGGGHFGVTPMGWTFQGGMPGTTNGRQLGNGVDQVLLIEAVLPTGEHVRFGPTSFEDDDEYLVPRTTGVSGVCNKNPEDPEELWIWEECAKEINFDDLWFAVRGGGGGTYGIVTSVYLQLHEYLPLEFIDFNFDCMSEEDVLPISILFGQFFMSFMLEPSSIGVSKEESSACAKPDFLQLYCYGEGSGRRFLDAWKDYALNLLNEPETLLLLNISESVIPKAATCLDDKLKIYPDYLAFASEFISLGPSVYPLSNDFGGPPNTAVGFPLDFYLKNKDIFLEVFPLNYLAMGGQGNRFGHDQTTSFPPSIRNAAVYIQLPLIPIDGDTSPLQLSMISDAYNISSTDTSIPGYLAPNHMSPFAYGPLKSDPTQPCDVENFTFEEAEEKCYSSQEATWGTEVLARLEAIKEAVDPNHILNCYKCVGHKETTFDGTPLGSDAAETTTTSTATTSDGFHVFHSRTGVLFGSVVVALVVSLL